MFQCGKLLFSSTNSFFFECSNCWTRRIMTATISSSNLRFSTLFDTVRADRERAVLACHWFRCSVGILGNVEADQIRSKTAGSDRSIENAQGHPNDSRDLGGATQTQATGAGRWQSPAPVQAGCSTFSPVHAGSNAVNDAALTPMNASSAPKFSSSRRAQTSEPLVPASASARQRTGHCSGNTPLRFDGAEKRFRQGVASSHP